MKNLSSLLMQYCVTTIIILASLNISPADAANFEITTDAEIHVIGNINGAYQALRETLQHNSLTSADDIWIGGKAHLVSLGDFLSKAPQDKVANRQILDLWMTLQQQASAAGGGVEILLGDNEIMALTDQFAALETGQPLSQTPQGQWLAEQAFVVRINRQLFAHAGLSHNLQIESLASLNATLSKGLKDYTHHWRYFVDHELRNRQVPFSKRFDYVKNLSESEARAKFLALKKNILFNNQSPVFYRGNLQCHSFFESDFLAEKLEQLAADRLWVTHAVEHQTGVKSRFDGRLIILANEEEFADDDLREQDLHEQDSSDGNMLAKSLTVEPVAAKTSEHFWHAKIVTDQPIVVTAEPQGVATSVDPIPNRRWSRPFGYSDKAIEDFLLAANITSKTETMEGRTKPLKITLEKDGKKLNAIFKFIDHSSKRHRLKFFGAGDRYQYEMAAYHLDRMLGINLVPVTVEREVEGREGTVQLWMENMASALQINEGEVDYTGHCDVLAQENMMNVFDYLIMNFDRNQTNILFTKDDWQIWFIDHTRAFGTPIKQPPFQRGVALTVSAKYRTALESLTHQQVEELEPWLQQDQIDALWIRRNRLLSKSY